MMTDGLKPNKSHVRSLYHDTKYLLNKSFVLAQYVNGAFTLPDTDIDTETETDIDIDKLTQNPEPDGNLC